MFGLALKATTQTFKLRHRGLAIRILHRADAFPVSLKPFFTSNLSQTAESAGTQLHISRLIGLPEWVHFFSFSFFLFAFECLQEIFYLLSTLRLLLGLAVCTTLIKKTNALDYKNVYVTRLYIRIVCTITKNTAFPP